MLADSFGLVSNLALGLVLPREIVVALIGIVGVALSAVVSWLVSKAQVRAEIGKLRLEMQRTYLENIHRARLSVFPDLYSAVEGYAKAIQRRDLTFEAVRAFHRETDQWHTSNGYLLTAATNSTMYTFLRRLANIARSNSQSLETRLLDNEKRRQMIRTAWELELALKNDLGIFEVEFFDPDKKFRSYLEVTEALDRDDG